VQVRALLDELSAGSERFRELWARGDVGHSTGIVHSRHPEVGDPFSPSDPARRPSLGRAADADVLRRTWWRASQSVRETSIPRQLLPEYGSLGNELRFLPI
jgi:hypothetical protein